MMHGYAKLGDFGFAKIETKKGDLRRVKTLNNKIKFTAPEIFEKKNFTEKTDIWFLGVTFFQLMIFKFPFKGDTDDEIMKSILNESKSDYNFSYSDNFKDLINKMISKNPDNRPSPDEILDMPFIRKRMECYVDENENLFLKSKKSLDIFNNIEEIKTVESFGENQKENKKK
jgi:serine/threonine protein kinase